jgi:threonine/homoserine/homoserine lactone efflux protein
MSAESYLAYVAALLIAVASPGPAMIAVMSAAAGRGRASGIATGVGVAIADILLVIAALAGLAALMAAFEPALLIVKWVGGAYLIWIGVRMWRHAADPVDQTEADGKRSLTAGFAVGLSNPKAVLFHASLMPLVIDIARINLAAAGLIVATVAAVNLTVMGALAALAGHSGALLRSPKGRLVLNRSAGGAMVGAGAVIIAR